MSNPLALCHKTSDGCWLWTGPRHSKTGKPTYHTATTRNASARKVIYELCRGPIPPRYRVHPYDRVRIRRRYGREYATRFCSVCEYAHVARWRERQKAEAQP